jgi:hypothetical protein
MNEIFQQWLAARGTANGMLVSGIRRPAGQCLCQGNARSFPTEQLEKILHFFAGSGLQFPEGSGIPIWSKWVFDEGQVCFVGRPDGSLLALVVRPETDAAQNLGALAGEFLALEAPRA